MTAPWKPARPHSWDWREWTTVPPGTRVTLNDVSFVATLHGPMEWVDCVDCGRPCLAAVPDPGRGIQPCLDARCNACGRAFWGLS